MTQEAIIEDISQFRDKLWKMKKDKTNFVSNLSDFEQKVKEKQVIILRNNPTFVLIFYSIFLATVIALSIAFSRYDTNVAITLMSIWFGSAIIIIPIVLSKILIIHPDGFLYRKAVFFKFSMMWKRLTSPPETKIQTGSQGDTYHIIKFTYVWGVKRLIVSSIKIKGLKNRAEKLQLIGETMVNYYNQAHSS